MRISRTAGRTGSPLNATRDTLVDQCRQCPVGRRRRREHAAGSLEGAVNGGRAAVKKPVARERERAARIDRQVVGAFVVRNGDVVGVAYLYAGRAREIRL